MKGIITFYYILQSIKPRLYLYCPQEEGRVNSRCKDLVDVLLLAELLDQTEASLLFEAFELTFSHRNTHSIPKMLARPPEH